MDRPPTTRSYGAAAVETVLRALDATTVPLPGETIPVAAAGGRVLAAAINAPTNLPAYRRAMMDGYAVRSVDLVSASPESPLALKVVGRCRPGQAPQRELESGQALDTTTGAPVPDSADTVIPREQILGTFDGSIQVQTPAIPGKHVGAIGEDVKRGESLFPRYRRLRPQDLGLLAALGIRSVEVVRDPRILIFSSGPEILPPGVSPRGYQIADTNSPMLQAAIERDGGTASFAGTLPDSPAAFIEALQHGADLIVISGGTSVGAEDWGPRVLSEIGKLEFHGIAIRPGAPTAIGSVGPKRVFLLPGNPVACLFAYDLMVGRVIRRLAARASDWPYPKIHGTLTHSLQSQKGRVDYVRVLRRGDQIEPILQGGASILSSTTRADGFLLVDADATEIPAGSIVEVFVYDA